MLCSNLTLLLLPPFELIVLECSFELFAKLIQCLQNVFLLFLLNLIPESLNVTKSSEENFVIVPLSIFSELGLFLIEDHHKV